MSEEKLYAVKNDKGLLLSYSEQGAPLWRVWGEMLADKPTAKITARAENGHVVTLIEEPKKVVLTKEQTEIVEDARGFEDSAGYISDSVNLAVSGEEKLLMKAYVNGYNVANEKKYGVWVPHVKGKMYYKDGRGSDDLDIASADCLNDKNQQFIEAEIKHYGLQDCEKEEVTDDEQ